MDNQEQLIATKAAYDAAQEAQKQALSHLDEFNRAMVPFQEMYAKAKRQLDAGKSALALAKALLARADADVIIARAAYALVAPKADVTTTSGKGRFGNAKLLEAVLAALATKPEGMTNGDIFDAVMAAGVEMSGTNPRANFNAYLSRWGTAGRLISRGTGKWGVVIPNAYQAFDTAIPEAPVPSFLAPPPIEARPTFVLDEQFPGYIPLTEAGFTSSGDLAGKTVEELQGIAGIGAKTATKILEALAV